MSLIVDRKGIQSVQREGVQQGSGTAKLERSVSEPTANKQAYPPQDKPGRPWTLGRVVKVGICLIVFALLFLAVVGTLNPNPAMDAARDARDAVNRQLKDADSAEYRNIDVHKLTTGKLLVCGEVNARNGFGAMTGYVRFVAPGGGVALIESPTGDRSMFDDLWDTWGCTGAKGELLRHDVTVLG